MEDQTIYWTGIYTTTLMQSTFYRAANIQQAVGGIHKMLNIFYVILFMVDINYDAMYRIEILRWRAYV